MRPHSPIYIDIFVAIESLGSLGVMPAALRDPFRALHTTGVGVCNNSSRQCSA